MSEIVEAHLPCDKCGSSDAVTLYDDGHSYCFSCDDYKRGNESPLQRAQHKHHKPLDCIDPSDMEYKTLKARGITLETCRKYDYQIAHVNGKIVQVASYKDNDGSILFQKLRDKDKNMTVRGKTKDIFYGQHLFTGGGKRLVITEGEIDCLTMSQVQGNKYPVVSVPLGCKSALKTFKAQLSWLEKFDEVVVMFDMDEAGQEAVKSVCGLLSPHKLKIASLELKDPNEMLKAGKAGDLINAMFRATEYRPDGIRNAKDLKEEFFESLDTEESYTFPWNPDLNKMTNGVRKEELTLFTAGTGIGKSTACRELALKLVREDKRKVGMVMLEEANKKTLRDLLSIYMEMPLHLLCRDEEVRNAMSKCYDELYNGGNFVLYNHFGSMESDNLIQQIRYMAVGEECDFIILDHITIAISGIDTDQGDVKAIDMLMTKLRSLVEETGVGIIVVSHLRKTGNGTVGYEEGAAVSLDSLRGSGALKQIPDTVIALERNQQADTEDEKNLVRMRVLKCRFTGTTGLSADPVRWNPHKNKLEDADRIPRATQDEKDEANCPF